MKFPLLLFFFFMVFSLPAIGMRGAASSSSGKSSEYKYPVTTIPEDLKKNADIVLREYIMNVEVKSLTSIVIKVHRVITILRKNGIEHASLEIPYDQFSKVTSIHGVKYNESGVETGHVKSSEIMDESAIPDGLFYTDDRVKKINIIGLSYPFTIEYSYELDLHKILNYPAWQPQDDYHVSVEHSEFTLTVGNDLMPRFRESNIPQPARIVHEKEVTSVTYTFDNLPAVEKEPYSIPLEERVPKVFIAPNDYRILGEDYDFRTWKSFGLWAYSLKKGRDILPDKTHKQLMDLLKDKSDNIVKIRTIYRFVQENTRYLAVTLGIGGWQPEEARTVAEKGYGDCKGLVNYTNALLSTAGITSYYTLVNAGEDASDIFPDFPSNQFNHVILCVPQETDTVWLECTNQYQPFGFLGSFTADRHVLLITPEGGRIVKTPEYTETVNTQNRKTVIELDTNGNASVGVKTIYRGLQYENVEGMENKSVQYLEKILFRKIKSSSAKLNKINYSFKKDQIPEALETIDLSVRSLATRTGNRIFLPFNLFGNITASLNEVSSRKTPLNFRYSYIDSDTVEVHIPSGFRVESLPGETEVSSQFGHYQITTSQKGDVLWYFRVFEMKKGRYAPESFTEFTNYLKSISIAEKNNAVLIRKDR